MPCAEQEAVRMTGASARIDADLAEVNDFFDLETESVEHVRIRPACAQDEPHGIGSSGIGSVCLEDFDSFFSESSHARRPPVLVWADGHSSGF